MGFAFEKSLEWGPEVCDNETVKFGRGGGTDSRYNEPDTKRIFQLLKGLLLSPPTHPH